MRAQRLAELQRAAQAKAHAQAAGHGALADVPEARLLREVAGAGGAPLVTHVAWEGSPLCDELDEHLAGLAHRHLGTRFLRVRAGPASTLHLRLRTPPGPGEPGLGQVGRRSRRLGGCSLGRARPEHTAQRMLPQS